MSTIDLALQPPMTRDETATLVGRTMALIAATAGTFSLGAYLGRDASSGWSWVFTVVALVSLLGINAAVQRSAALAIGLLLAFGVLMGLSVAPTLSYYANTESDALWQAGAATTLFIAGFGAAGYATRRDLSGLARYLLWALVALIVAGIVLIFVEIPGGAVIWSVLGLVIFAGLTAYDFQRLRQAKDIREAPLLAVSIFLDILNVFFLTLSLFGGNGE